MPRRPILAAAIASLVCATPALAIDLYWDGTGTGWNTIPSWTTDPANPNVDPVAVPGINDVAIFNVAGVIADQIVNLNADQAAASLTVNTSGATSILGGDANHALTLVSGLTVNAGGGPLTIGSATAGQQVMISLFGHQTWANNSGALSTSAINVVNPVVFGTASANTVADLVLAGNTPTAVTNTISGSIVESGLGILSLAMSPASASTRWHLAGANNYRGATNITAGALRISHPNALGSTTAGTNVAAGGGLFLDNAGTIAAEPLVLAGDGPTGAAFGALQAVTGTSRWTGPITVNTGATSGRIAAISSSTLLLDGLITASGTGQLVFQTGNSGTNSGIIVVNSDISFPGQRLTKSATGSSAGTVILNGSNNYGNTIISSGTLQVGNGGTTGNLGTGAVSVANTATGTLAFKRRDNITVANAISGSGTIAHTGTGGVTLTGNNTHTGATSVTGGGTLTLDFSALATPTNLVGAGALTLTGSKLSVLGKSTDTTSQSFSGTTLTAGPSAVIVNSNGGTATNVALGAFTRAVAGGTLVISPPASGNITTTTANTAEILGGYLTVENSNWAANDGAGNIVALPNYSSDLDGTGNLNVPSGGGTLIGTPNTVRFHDPSANTLTIPAARAVTAGGILVTPNVGANLSQISGNFALTTGTGLDLIVFQNNPAGGLTINSPIGSSITKTGPGLLTLAGGNVANFTTRISAGTLSVSNASNLGGQGGTGAIIFPVGSTGALQITGNGTYTSSKGFTLSGNGIVDVTQLATMNSGVSVTGPGSLTKTGNGTLIFSASTGANNYTGATIIDSGTLQTNTLANGGSSSGIGASSSDAANLVLNGGTLKYASTTVGATTDRLFTVGPDGGAFDASGAAGMSVNFTNGNAIALSGANTARTFILTGTNTDANILAPILGDNGSGATSLEKTGPGSWTLAGLNTFSGGTDILGGTLTAGSNGAFGSGDVTVATTAVSLTIASGFTNTISNSATLSLAGDGALDGIAVSGFAFLASGINETVGGLILGGIVQNDLGTYGATGSGAAHTFNDYFQGPGVVTLVPEPSAAIALLSGLSVLLGAQRFRRR